jgi:putative ABC transport system substrate-binding protein
LGFTEGRNFRIEYRFADGKYDKVPDLVNELKSLPANVIVAVPSSPVALAAKAATSTIPILFFVGLDPVQVGLVVSYNRPGGNITGISLLSDELTAKRVELIHELLPDKSGRLVLLVNPSNFNTDNVVRGSQSAARSIGRDLIVVGATNEEEIRAAFDTVAQQKAAGMVVWQEAYLTSQRTLIVSLAQRHAIPAIYGTRLFTDIGGLMSYGADVFEMYRLMGTYVGKILNGVAPADLPVLQPTKFELVISLKTARTLGLTMPDKLLVAANEVIE